MTGSEQSKTENKIEQKDILLAEFFESTPPSASVWVKNAFKVTRYTNGRIEHELNTPQLQLHCTSDVCNGLRFFRFTDGNRTAYADGALKSYLTFICSNCRTVQKTYSVLIQAEVGNERAACFKFGEMPAFGPPTPARLIRLFGDDRETFLKGRRCEIQGLGIGAFVYYRRVVENQKDRILDEVIRVSDKIGAGEAIIEGLKRVKEEKQFSRALSLAKDAIPPSLLINGHNPLLLLHGALSVGVHQLTDELCLERAHDIRVVLMELADRLGQALKDEAELNTAVSRLLQSKGAE